MPYAAVNGLQLYYEEEGTGLPLVLLGSRGIGGGLGRAWRLGDAPTVQSVPTPDLDYVLMVGERYQTKQHALADAIEEKPRDG